MKRIRDGNRTDRIDRFFSVVHSMTEPGPDGRRIKRYTIEGIEGQMFDGKNAEVPNDADPVAYIVETVRKWRLEG